MMSDLKSKKWSAENFDALRLLGKGTFGDVFLVRNKEVIGPVEHNQFALKVLNKKQIHANQMEEYVRNEIEIQSHLHHRNIVKCFGFFHDEHNVYLVLEYLETTIYNELQQQRYKRFDEKRAARIMLDVAEALSFMHERLVIHRDVKPDNLLLHPGGTVKLADFGLSVRLQNGRRKTLCGSQPYMAPEIQRLEPYSIGVDLWSMGILCHELLTGTRPEVKTGFKISISIPKQAKQLIMALLHIEPRHRLSSSDVKIHPWIVSQFK